MSNERYDIIVVGGGHAGIEAAVAAARLGARTALVTHDVNEIGRMPCNPAIGGLGKGHLVREIDVLGGLMGQAIDATGIQFRVLNRKKGPAVQSPRAQADKHEYQRWMMEAVLGVPGLDVIAGDACELDLEPHESDSGRRRVCGVELVGGKQIRAERVVLCSGTFLRGLMHVGDQQTIGGREGAASSEGLSGSLGLGGLELRRLKTGTPPRLLRDSIDVSRLKPQPGDEPPLPFSFRTGDFTCEQIDCYMAYTTPATHEIIAGSLGRSPLFGGAIAGQGPRYCPSIEDKVVRFADKDRHLLFLEPEGRNTEEVYVNGLSTSLPADVQERVVRSVPGLEGASIIRYGYAVEYDSIPSWQVGSNLEARPVAGLFLAGQILGTSGYEEAAAQGLIAGVNAVRDLGGGEPVTIGRDEGYIGVLIDDLVTKEIDEPYRMFTSRAEHRLYLRCDNVEDRLLALTLDLGLLPKDAQNVLEARCRFVQRITELLNRTSVFVKDRGVRVMATDFLKYPGSSLALLAEAAQVPAEFEKEYNIEAARLLNSTHSERMVNAAAFQVENDIKYDGYIAKQNRLLRNREHLDHLELPSHVDYKSLTALSFESREKLAKIRPATLGQAGRIDGVRAGDLAVLTVYLKKLTEENERESKNRDPS